MGGTGVATIFHFSADLPIAISIKTRAGFADEDEFDCFCDIYSRYPMKSLTIHPRLKSDQYKGSVRLATLDRVYASQPMPVGYNGDIVTPADCFAAVDRYPKLAHIMIGRALSAPSQKRGGPAATFD